MAQELERINRPQFDDVFNMFFPDQQAWFSYKEAGKELGMTRNGFNHLINRHKDIREKFVKNFRPEGGRKGRYISKDGLTLLIALKRKGNQHQKEDAATLNHDLKVQLAEKAIGSQQMLVTLAKQVSFLTDEMAKLKEQPKQIGEELSEFTNLNSLLHRFQLELK